MTEKSKGLKAWWNDILQSIEYDSKDNFYYIALLSAPLLLTIYRYFTEAQDFLVYFPSLQVMEQGEIYAYVLEYFSFAILFMVIPFFILKHYKKDEILKEIFQLPTIPKNMKWVLVVLFFFFIWEAFVASSMSDVLVEYPLPRKLLTDQSMLWLYFLAYLLLYYLPWEFFFRGFLLFGMKKKYGIVAAILIQTISSCLVHIDKPVGEILGSMPFGIVFGIVAINTRSIWVVLFLHALLGMLTDTLIIF